MSLLGKYAYTVFMVVRFLITIFLFILLSSPCIAGGKKVVLTSLAWPPYTGENLEYNGATAEVVRAAFDAVGYELEILFYPWNRAVDEAQNNPEVMGYFPEYPSEERAREFLFSDSVGKSPLGFAKRRARSLSWRDYDELRYYVIGTVDGYVNTERFDRMVASGEIQTDVSVSDTLNVRKVLAGRVDMGVVDMNVYEYLLKNDALLHSRRGELRMDSRLLAINDLYVCFRKGAEGEALLKLFNEGLSRISPLSIQRDYIDRINR